MEFDYVVVGGGSAGCALASRLAERADVTVALLEAGPADHHPLVSTPVGAALMLPFRNARNWALRTEPQPGLGGRRGYQPRGRGLGGSSSLNAMIYTRGHPSDYDAWAAAGCDGWSFADVLPYFRRAECNARAAGRDDDAWHGGRGPLHVSDLVSPNPFSRAFVQAAVQAGYRRSDDFNGPSQEGVGFYQVTQHRGERWNAARAYLHRGERGDRTHNAGRANLAVLTGAHALAVMFEERRARGVRIVRGGTPQLVRARREVVLAAGAFGSPQLLMCSGIGPAEPLRALGIPVLHDAPEVGRNLQDHLDVTLHRRVRSTDLFGYSLRGAVRMAAEARRYRRARTGMLTSNFAEAGGFVRSRDALAVPDLQLHFVVGMADNHNRTFNAGHGYSCHVCVLRPASRGEVRLRSADAREAPAIDPRFLSDPADLPGMVAGVRIVRRIFSQPALARLGGTELYSSHLRADGSDDDAVAALVRERADTIYHPVGTCRMGSDARSVLDARLRVRGVSGLRVVDASVMPTLVAGNTNAPAIMVAEKAADLMRQDDRR